MTKNNWTYLITKINASVLIKQKESKSLIDSLVSVSRKITYSDTSYYIVNKYLRNSNILGMPNNYERFKTQKFIKDAIPIPNFFEIDDFDENTYNLLKKS